MTWRADPPTARPVAVRLLGQAPDLDAGLDAG